MKMINKFQKKVLGKIVGEVSKQNFVMLEALNCYYGVSIDAMIREADGDYDKFWQKVADTYNEYLDSTEVVTYHD